MARLTTQCHKYNHITPVLSVCTGYPSKKGSYKALVLTYKALPDLAPPHLKSLLVPYIPGCSLHSSSRSTLVLKCHTKSYGARALSHFAPIEYMYNKLPCVITQAKTLDTLKSKLKTHLSRLAYPQILRHSLFYSIIVAGFSQSCCSCVLCTPMCLCVLYFSYIVKRLRGLFRQMGVLY